jgi:hypothetical protein
VRWNDLSWLKSNRPLLIAEIIGITLVAGWLLFAYFNGHDAFALVILALLPVFAVANLVIVNRTRGRLADPTTRRDETTGLVLSPGQIGTYPTMQIERYRWTGAADMPGSMGRMHASMPLGVLELYGGQLSIRVRPRFLMVMFGAKPLVVSPADVEAVFPARVRLRYAAIGVRPRNQPPAYFLVMGQDRTPILNAIAASSFLVEWEERRYSIS